MMQRFKRAVHYRKWSILLFPLTGPVGIFVGGLLTANPFDFVQMAIFYFGLVIMVIAYFMAKDSYKEHLGC